MNLDAIIDFATEAHRQVGKYMLTVTLSPEKMMKGDYDFNTLRWDSIPYGEAELDKVPGNKRGVYAFAVCQNSKVLPPHGYILY